MFWYTAYVVNLTPEFDKFSIVGPQYTGEVGKFKSI